MMNLELKNNITLTNPVLFLHQVCEGTFACSGFCLYLYCLQISIGGIIGNNEVTNFKAIKMQQAITIMPSCGSFVFFEFTPE